MKKHIIILNGILLLMFGAVSHHGLAQSVDIDFIEFTGRNVIVHYNLDDGANSSRQFLVQLYSSQDNFTTPLTRVTGDFGPEVSAGVDKKIVWDITQELGAFKGNISLELRGRVYVPFVKIKDIEDDQVFKRGRNYPLNWTSGNLSGQVNIELFNEAGERMWGENNVANVGKFDWYIQGNIKKGDNYKLKFTNAKDRNDVVYSRPFIIKPKIPLLVKAGSLLIVAGATQFLLRTNEAASEEKPYPAPPAAPNN
jgi:hypothetical protein